ncbi:hypothetical protein CPC08DRAFT_769157 [Agrocybe pediades]|nr:hypothetical protein CPC08DRAFT_769157 [Agrocybe pediades]
MDTHTHDPLLTLGPSRGAHPPLTALALPSSPPGYLSSSSPRSGPAVPLLALATAPMMGDAGGGRRQCGRRRWRVGSRKGGDDGGGGGGGGGNGGGGDGGRRREADGGGGGGGGGGGQGESDSRSSYSKKSLTFMIYTNVANILYINISRSWLERLVLVALDDELECGGERAGTGNCHIGQFQPTAAFICPFSTTTTTSIVRAPPPPLTRVTTTTTTTVTAAVPTSSSPPPPLPSPSPTPTSSPLPLPHPLDQHHPPALSTATSTGRTHHHLRLHHFIRPTGLSNAPRQHRASRAARRDSEKESTRGGEHEEGDVWRKRWRRRKAGGDERAGGRRLRGKREEEERRGRAQAEEDNAKRRAERRGEEGERRGRRGGEEDDARKRGGEADPTRHGARRSGERARRLTSGARGQCGMRMPTRDGLGDAREGAG